ncbi:hypothetical protein G7K_6693-t1 [Saitoella complicata NRRL Y-17804]|uniref:Uncharacterized protein n=1 Tax=Saitoella complicata (strain BCRC 22490 / CBS 7301 / JCM 7358 / NBRC 10748 / NRRL Y-17804) TaxID=698492 RepID=A0A0E9NT76_SAICN|nr:hypothetical protein G7K_6693-t1 [Saitoella complicata NRRL Y-17804]
MVVSTGQRRPRPVVEPRNSRCGCVEGCSRVKKHGELQAGNRWRRLGQLRSLDCCPSRSPLRHLLPSPRRPPSVNPRGTHCDEVLRSRLTKLISYYHCHDYIPSTTERRERAARPPSQTVGKCKMHPIILIHAK